MLTKLVLFVICYWFVIDLDSAEGLKIAAYNVRNFGETKLNNVVAMNMITQIVKQYDIILIQEVRGFNTPHRVANQLLNWVGTDQYAICNSAANFKPATGSHRELYLYLYRPASVACLGTVEADSPAVNPMFTTKFRRPPTIAKFQSRTSTGTHFFVVGIHTQPSNAVNEINSLVDVYNTFLSKQENSNFQYGFVIGDYNYGGTYVNQNLQDMLAVDMHLTRIIDRHAQTSVLTHLPYDRIYIGSRTGNIPANFNRSQGVDTFRDSLTERDYYRSVSDHYPVYVDVNLGNNGGVRPTSFPASTAALTAAQTEECNAVRADSQRGPLEKDEQEFLNFCNQIQCSVSQISSKEDLPETCLFGTNQSVKLMGSIFIEIFLVIIVLSDYF